RRLAAVEWRAADWVPNDLTRYDLLISRMSAANWLAAAGRADEAIQLLRAVDSDGLGKMADTYVAAGPAQAMLGGLLEAGPDMGGAVEASRQAMRRLDLATGSQRDVVDAARQGLARLGRGEPGSPPAQRGISRRTARTQGRG